MSSSRPSRRRTLFLTAAAVVTAAIATIGGAAIARAAETPERDPVIFVHGLYGSPSNFDTMRTRFRLAGYPSTYLVSFGYTSTGSMITAAEQLAAEVNSVLARTGAKKVDFVTHSLGALPSRWYIRYLGGLTKVDDWISLGGPNLGGDPGTCPAPGSVACGQATKGSDFINQLNSGDPTPGDITYTTYTSTCDTVVDPSWTRLTGAENVSVGCVSHFNLVSNTSVITQVRTKVST